MKQKCFGPNLLGKNLTITNPSILIVSLFAASSNSNGDFSFDLTYNSTVDEDYVWPIDQACSEIVYASDDDDVVVDDDVTNQDDEEGV